MAFGVGAGQDDIKGTFSKWFPDMKPDKMEELLEKLDEYKLIKDPKYGYYIDGGGELSIYSGDPEDPDEFIYEGSVFGLVYELMNYLNVRNDNERREDNTSSS